MTTPVDAQQVSEAQPGEMAAASVAAPADVRPPSVPLTRRQLRELAAREAAARPTASAEAPAMVVEPAGEIVEGAAFRAAAHEEAAQTEPASEERSAAQAQAVVDEFEAAARLFSFTGETPVQVAEPVLAEEAPEPAAAETAEPVHTARRGRSFFRRGAVKRVTTASATIGAMGVVGLLAVGLTTPVEAVAAASGSDAVNAVSLASGSKAGDEIQAYVAPATAETASLDRADYGTATVASMAAELGISHFSSDYTNNPNAAIQWPFAVGVPVSSGFGERWGRMHEGADFTPGEGARVQAIAAGTVRQATESGGAYGVVVVIDHVIDGKLISTRYGHMLYGSLQVREGDTVVAGQYLGRTGNTGRSFGAHTHVEVLLNGTTAIDPIVWLRENAGRMSLDG